MSIFYFILNCICKYKVTMPSNSNQKLSIYWIVAVLKEVEADIMVKELCQEYGGVSHL